MLKLDNLKLSVFSPIRSTTDRVSVKSISQDLDIYRENTTGVVKLGLQPMYTKPYKWNYLPLIYTPGLSIAQTGVAATTVTRCSAMPKVSYKINDLEPIPVRFSLTLRYGGNFGVVFIANKKAFYAVLSQTEVTLQLNHCDCYEFMGILRPTPDMVGKTVVFTAVITRYPQLPASGLESVKNLANYRLKAMKLTGEYTEAEFPTNDPNTGVNPYRVANHALLEVG